MSNTPKQIVLYALAVVGTLIARGVAAGLIYATASHCSFALCFACCLAVPGLLGLHRRA